MAIAIAAATWEQQLAISLSYRSLPLNIPLSILDGGAFVVGLLAFGESNFCLDQVALPVQLGADTGAAFLLSRNEQPGQLLLMQEQFLGTTRVGDDVGARSVQRRDVATQ